MFKLEVCPISNYTMNTLCDLGKQPIFMGTTSQDKKADIYNEMTWGYTDCGIVHLLTRIPLKLLYSQSHNSGLVGKVWRDHHLELAEFISKYKPQNICEIGGGHGILCSNYSKINDYQSWEIFEPNASESFDCRVTLRNELFDANSQLESKDCIIHSHLFEHLYDHKSILDKVHSSLSSEGLMIFSLPNMNKMLQNSYVNALNFEHVTYLPEDLVDHLLHKHGFSVVEKKYFLDDHSIFYCCNKTSPNKMLEYYSPNNIEIVRSFFHRIKKNIIDLNEKIENLPKDTSIYLFGAHIFSQFYLNNGLESSRVIEILDNDLAKQNHRLYGSHINVGNPETIRDVKQPVVILKVGAYRDEIITQLQNINPTVKILE